MKKKKGYVLLIDADNLIYHASWGQTNMSMARGRFDDLLDGILSELFCYDYVLYIKDPDVSSNYRFGICSDYKSHRSAPPPLLKPLSRQIIKDNDNAVGVSREEVDDAVSIQAWKYKRLDRPYIVVSPDKDLDQIPGEHFDNYFTRRKRYRVLESESDRFLYQQILSGDPSDNIKGLYRVGPKVAKTMLADCHTEKEMYDKVKSIWMERHPDNWKELMTQCARLVYIRRRDNELWKPKTHKHISKIWKSK